MPLISATLAAPLALLTSHLPLLFIGVVGGLLLGGLVYGAFRALEHYHSVQQTRRLEALVAVRTRELQEIQEHFRGLSEATFEAVLIHNQGIITQANRAASDLTGYRSEQLIGMDLVERLVATGWRSQVREAIRLQLEGPYEAELRRADGGCFPVEVSARTVPSQGQELRVAAMRDISARKAVEQALREERDFSSTIVNIIAALVIVLDRDGRIVRFNRQCEVTTGYCADEMLGQCFWDLFLPPEERPGVEQVFRNLLHGTFFEHYENYWLTRDGERRLIDWSSTCLYTPGGEVEYVIGTGIDITERRQAEESLRKLLRAVEHSHSTIVITNLAGEIEFANPAFTRITGYSLEEVLGQNTRILKSGQTPPEVYRSLWETLARGEVWQGELLNRKKDGSLYWEGAVISPVLDASGRTTHYVAVKDDITARRQMEETLRQSNEALRQRMEEIEALQAQLREQALRDPLTGAFNRRYLVETLARELAQAARAGEPVSLVIMDVDHFKGINDAYGHQAGDVVLQGLVQLLTACTRKGDVVCRYGGEEFVVLMPGTTVEDAYRRAEEWRLAFAEARYTYGVHRMGTTVSLGLASVYPKPGPLDSAGDDLLRAADQGLYRAKSQGRNQTIIAL